MSVHNDFKIYNGMIEHPSAMIISGPSGSGKTEFAINFLKNLEKLVDADIDYIIWCYGQKTKQMEHVAEVFLDKIEFHEGLPNDFNTLMKQDKKGIILIDDCQMEAIKSEKMVDLLTKQSHHNDCSVILILQDIFHGSTIRKTIYRNAHYLVLFRTPLDNSIPFALANKIFPYKSKIFLDIYNAATKRAKYSYLFVSGRVSTPDEIRFRSDIFNPNFQRIYVPIMQ